MAEQDEHSRRRDTPLEVSHPHLREFLGFLPDLNRESDRGRVLIACSYLDDLLRRTLLAFLVRGRTSERLVDGFNAPLGTFSTRTAAAYSLGLITDREFKEAETLRRIRNNFAHEIKVSVETPKVTGLCKSLTMAAQDYGDVVVDARGMFTTSAVALISDLINRPHYVSRKALTSVTWPI